VFENRVLKRIFGPKRKWREAGEDSINKGLNNLCAPPEVIQVIKSRRMKWAGHIARIEEIRDT
jgi:hypothetical protein